MSGATTRGKNKKHKLTDVLNDSSEILRRIHLTGQVTDDDVDRLFMTWKPVCNGCRVNSKDSPNCFCGLIPSGNSHRKSGLWQKISEIVSALGPDPTLDLRSADESPAGLSNLGATCYANSILQCLFMNGEFRCRLFSVEAEILMGHTVLDQLSRLFAQLALSERSFIDSAPFISTLELDNSVQQDCHEFLTLLLSLLESCLASSNVPTARTLVQDLFRGSISHVTRCSSCGKESEASSKMEDFYGLELNIKGLSSLDESLDDYLSVEEMTGENQYLCEYCNFRVDATRCIKLQILPAVLCLQLKRYVFLPKTTTKKKILSSFSFPKLLDMGKRVSSESDTHIYDLSAILVHKGSAANSGHYVAHIKDRHSGCWWEFDDEQVSKLGAHPFDGTSSSSQSRGDRKVTEFPDADLESHLVNGKFSLQSEVYSSVDAYMLMYTRTSPDPKGSFLKKNLSNGKEENCTGIFKGNLPSYLLQEIEETNKTQNAICEDYRDKKQNQLKIVNERRDEVRTILEEAPVQSGYDFFWISTDWLRQWTDALNPLPVDNSSISCSHSKVLLSKTGAMKRISSQAWTKLFTKYGGGPTLSCSDFCIDCIKDAAKALASADNYRDQRAAVKGLVEDALNGKFCGGNSYFVSKSWLQQWLRRKNVDTHCDADARPTASITCPHEMLLPEQTALAKRVVVPEELWFFFLQNAKKVKPDDPSGYHEYPSDNETCSICQVELSEIACSEDSIRETKLKQRQNHDSLYQGKSISVCPGCRYYLLPSSWINQWRSYLTTNSRNTFSEIDSLEIVLDSIRCAKHSLLLLRPYDLVHRRGEIVQKVTNMDGLTIVTENDWKLFCEEWKVSGEKGIFAEIELVGYAPSCPLIVSEEASTFEMDIVNVNGDTNHMDQSKPVIQTSPRVCEDCIGEREVSQLMKRLDYVDEDIRVHFVRGKDPPKFLLASSGSISEPDRRTSKRSRKDSIGRSVNLKVSGFTSLYQLKMMIWESFGIVKENQKLHKASVEIEGDSSTLADKGVLPGDVLWVTDTEIHEDRDIADEIADNKELRPIEEGFKGTLLTSTSLTKER